MENNINNVIGRGNKVTCQNKFRDEIGNIYTNHEDISNHQMTFL